MYFQTTVSCDFYVSSLSDAATYIQKWSVHQNVLKACMDLDFFS